MDSKVNDCDAIPGTSKSFIDDTNFGDPYHRNLPSCSHHGKRDEVARHHDDESSEEEDASILVVHMGVLQPLDDLRTLLEAKTGRSLVGFPFTLQKAQVLDGKKNLLEQCVEGEGLVQVNIKIEDDPSLPFQSIDIVDVLKPADLVEDNLNARAPCSGKHNDINGRFDCSDAELRTWVADPEYQQSQIRLGIPLDPSEWSEAQVRHWVVWAVRKFNLNYVKLAEWQGIDGKKLVNMSKEEFFSRVPCEEKKLFWMHFIVLVLCHVVALPNKENCEGDVGIVESSGASLQSTTPSSSPPDPHTSEQHSVPSCSSSSEMIEIVNPSQPASRLGDKNSATDVSVCKLWQFLLELLTDRRFKQFISWLQHEGEFVLLQPELVASLWGKRKGKPFMSYNNLARALRLYYESPDPIIIKVPGKKFVYKFVCDLKFLVGYSSLELRSLILEDVKTT